jgi:hypothetical protein
MRLGKEQAVGYVEDIETDSLPAQGPATDEAEGMPLAAAPEPPLTVS